MTTKDLKELRSLLIKFQFVAGDDENSYEFQKIFELLDDFIEDQIFQERTEEKSKAPS